MIASRSSDRRALLVEVGIALAVFGATLAVGAPIVRDTVGVYRLRSGASDLILALAEARREAFRTGATSRVEIDPADGRVSVFASASQAGTEVERKRYYLPPGVRFRTVDRVTSYPFDKFGRPAALTSSIDLIIATGQVEAVAVPGRGGNPG